MPEIKPPALQRQTNFVHITDPHLLDDSSESLHDLNTYDTLRAVLGDCGTRYPDIDFMLFTGDISQTGAPDSYALFKSLIDEVKIPIYCVPGNHDIPNYLQKIIPTCPDESLRIINLDECSLVLISSWVENEECGAISERSLEQLENHLKHQNGQLTILAIHHPPVLINCQWLDNLGLVNKDKLMDVIDQYNHNLLCIFGHIHQSIDQYKGENLRLISTPSTCHQFEANTDNFSRIYIPSPTYRYIELKAGNVLETRLHHVEVNS